MRVLQSRNPSDGFLACLTGLSSRTLTATHVIVYSLLTTRGTGSLKHYRNVEPFEELKMIRIEPVKGFMVEPILAAKFSYLLFVDIVDM